MHRRLAVLVCVLAVGAIAPAAALRGPDVGAGRDRHDPSGRPDLHRRRPVHRQLRLLQRERHLHRPGRPLLRHRRARPRPTAATPARCRSARRSRSTAARSPARSSTTRGSRCRPRARPTPTRASTTTSRSSSSTRPTTARSTRRCRSGAARTGGRGTTALATQVYSYGNSSLRARRHAAEPEGGRHPRPDRRRLEPHGLHGHPRHPGRLGQRVPERHRPGARHAQHGRDRAARRLQRRRRPRAQANYMRTNGGVRRRTSRDRDRAVRGGPAAVSRTRFSNRREPSRRPNGAAALLI